MSSSVPTPRPTLAERFHRVTGFPALFWLAVVGCSMLSMLLLAARLTATRQTGHLSLTWDLFLAWLPVGPALAVHHLSLRPIRRRWVVWSVGAIWLLFFPNAPYLVTQMIHLDPQYGPSVNSLPVWLDNLLPAMASQQSPEWFELLLLSSIFVTGLLLSFASLRQGREQQQALVRRRGAVGDLSLGVFLVVIRRQPVVLGTDERLDEAPGLAGDPPQGHAVVVGQRRDDNL